MLILFFYSSIANSQESKRALYFQKIEEFRQAGTYEPPSCLTERLKFPTNSSLRSNSAICDIFVGYGTEGLVFDDGTANANGNDPACTVDVPASCGGTSVYRIPIAITIFEDQGWTGQNYLDGDNTSGGFLALSDADIDTKIAELNSVYANAQIEFYEAVPRSREENADLYNFYRSTADPEDGIDDDPQTAIFDIANIVNVYFVGGIDGDHNSDGVTGYAPYPPSRDYFLMVYRGTFGTTLEHEFGHYLGLAHTHDDSVNGVPETSLDNSNCLTTGDGICDTWPDPNFQNCRNASCVYQQGGANCPALTIDPASGVNQGGGVSTRLQENIMGSNSFSGCRISFTPCQFSKLQDVLLGCRSNLCDPTVTRTSTTIFEICLGDPAPTFNAMSSCYSWYDGVGSNAQLLSSSTSSFQPSLGPDPGELNNQVAGTYEFYLGDANEYNPNCRTRLTVIVADGAGNGTPASIGDGNVPFTVTNTTSSTGPSNGIGYLFTSTDPATITNPAAVIGGATTSTATTLAANNLIIQSDVNGSLNNYQLDCGALGTGTYYLTPFVAYGEAAPECIDTGNGVNVNFTNGFGGAVSDSPVGPVNCTPTGLTLQDFELVLEVTSCEASGNSFYLNLRDGGNCGGASISSNFPTINCNVGATYTFDMAAINAVVPGFDPLSNSLCVSAINTDVFTGPTNPNGLSYSLILNAIYTGSNGFEEWDTNNGPTLSTDANCILGNPVEITCLGPTPVELLSFSGRMTEQIVTLEWETITEQNNDFFTLYRAADGRNFTAIAKVNGEGTTLNAQNYQYLDKQPLAGLNYYQLSQTDFDGTTEYVGGIVVVDNDKFAGGIQIQPNPIRANELVWMATVETAGTMNVQVYSMNGALMYNNQVAVERGNNPLSFSVTDLPKGVYILKTVRDNQTFTERFIKTE